MALMFGVVLIRTDDFADPELLPDVYVYTAVIGGGIGIVVGAVAGAAGLALAVQVARASSTSGAGRQLRGALAAAAVSAAAGLFPVGMALFGSGALAMLAVGVLGGVAAWLLLPSELDLSAAPRTVPPSLQSDTGQPPMSVAARTALTLVVAGGGSLMTVLIVMSVIAEITHVEKEASNAVAFGILAVAFVTIAVVEWRHLARPRPMSGN